MKEIIINSQKQKWKVHKSIKVIFKSWKINSIKLFQTTEPRM